MNVSYAGFAGDPVLELDQAFKVHAISEDRVGATISSATRVCSGTVSCCA
ncbi:hypothetical protein HNP84_006455 [Thermocatellispora tengchongensis]|uniref:Uncharacterized protein n=1 Tax=Thermocatellispora tengchongensis TaxID=1073253 RepID=A0A840P5V6_9ACTN|nr:hypothetical protein [Thermocatellispora tengchongensis]MBB5136704.1 hypothetical protein [Thermocatellispora tengchongensis]